MGKYFMCPICNKEIDLRQDFGVLSGSSDHYEYRLGNKRFHMKQHKKVKLGEKQLEKLTSKIQALKEKVENDKSWLQ